MTTGLVKQFPLEKEYAKNPIMKPEDIRKLRQWLETQPHLPGEYITDLDLVLVYHSCECSSEVSKQVLDLHYSLRTLFATFFKDRDLDDRTEHSMNTILYAPLPLPTVHGYRAIYVRLLDADPKNFFFNDVIRTFMMIFDLWQCEEGTWPGFVLMIDMDQSAIGHLARIEINSIRQVLFFLQECMLVRLKEVHFLNAPYFMDKVMMMLRPFMKKALMDIINIHMVNSNSLEKFVPKAALPKESGGDYKDSDTIRDELIKRMHNNRQFIRDENRRRVDESKRPSGAANPAKTMFGTEGSFKKLDID